MNIEIVDCVYCNKPFHKLKKHHKFCSPECARLAQPYYTNRKEQKKHCSVCDNDFLTFKKNQIYCSNECQKKANYLRIQENRYKYRNTPKLKLRFEVFLRDNFKCQYCGRTVKEGAILEVDHIKPESKGGELTLENLLTSCSACNLGKGDILLDLFSMQNSG